MHIPNEILEQALKDLLKADLKAARLVNSQWLSCANRFLFDTLYISPHKINIDVFQSVTQHPVLRHCVKHLCYDLVGFASNYTYPQYFARLWCQYLEKPFHSSDTQVNTFIESATCKPTKDLGLRLRMAMEKCGDFDAIKAGYIKWQEHALYQQECTENDNFVRILAVGLQRLDRLSVLSMIDDWPRFGYHVRAPAYLHGSPLARSWGTFDARPMEWAYFSGNRPHEYFAFWNMTIALPKYVYRLHNFEHEDGVSPAVVNSQSIATEPRLLPGIHAFARLKELNLTITVDDNDAAHYDSLRGLRHLLHCVRKLEALDLGFGADGRDYGSDWPTYESVFPRDGTWPHLRRFVVRNLRITGEDLIHLLVTRMFPLQHLKIGDMRLLHGTWERVIERLKFRRLSSLEISSYYLGYGDDQCFLEPIMESGGKSDEDNACNRFVTSIERYVVEGFHDRTMRHPSLKKDEPTQDSLDYLPSDFVLHELTRTGDVVHLNLAVLKTIVAEACAEAKRRRDMAVAAGLPEASTELSTPTE